MKTWKQQKLENGKCLTDLLSATRNGDNDLVQKILGMTELFMLTSSAIDELLEISQHQPELVLSVFASNKFKKIDLSEFRDDFIRNLTTDFVNKFFALDKIESCRSLHLIDVIEKTNNTDVIKKYYIPLMIVVIVLLKTPCIPQFWIK